MLEFSCHYLQTKISFIAYSQNFARKFCAKIFVFSRKWKKFCENAKALGIDLEYLGNRASNWILLFKNKIIDKKVLRKVKYVVKITEFSFSRKLSAIFVNFCYVDENKFSRKCENENFRFNPKYDIVTILFDIVTFQYDIVTFQVWYHNVSVWYRNVSVWYDNVSVRYRNVSVWYRNVSVWYRNFS
jgi:hypothetical protein